MQLDIAFRVTFGLVLALSISACSAPTCDERNGELLKVARGVIRDAGVGLSLESEEDNCGDSDSSSVVVTYSMTSGEWADVERELLQAGWLESPGDPTAIYIQQGEISVVAGPGSDGEIEVGATHYES